MKYNTLEIREIEEKEIPILSDFLYEAVFQQDESNPAPKDIVKKPELSVYINDFGRKDDHCLVAVCGGKIVGAVWTRIIKGYGSVDEFTPELAISLYKNYRKKGIGTKMMLKMLKLLKEKGYSKVSLSVNKNNPALKMYKKLDFKTIKSSKDEHIMIYKF